MTKKLFLTLVSVVFLVFLLVACGDKKENDTTDTGDTATTPDEDATDTGDTSVISDEDNADTDDPEPDSVSKEGCTTKSSFGSHSVKKDISSACIKAIAAAFYPECGWQNSEESTSEHIAFLQRLDVTFSEECKNKKDDEIVQCPDFVPKTLKLTKLDGCNVYSIDPDSACIAPCADLYFLTDNDVFKTVYAGASYERKSFIQSSGEGGVFLDAGFEIGVNEAVFTWSEKAADGTETKKEISVEMVIVDPDKCKDSEGKQYNEGDLIPKDCGILVCEEKGWAVYYGNRTECGTCRLDEAETKMWRCYDESELEWCNCIEDEETSGKYGEGVGKWSCIDRIDLQCPPRVEECVDSEGRKYKHDDKIAEECDYVYCTYAGWRPTGEHECYFSCKNIGEKLSWLCNDGVTEVDWCECVADEESEGIWTCIERADLQCPNDWFF